MCYAASSPVLRLGIKLPRVLSCVVTSTVAAEKTSACSFASAYTSARVSKVLGFNLCYLDSQLID